MKIEKQVISLELARKLKKLGVKQNSLFYWLELYDKTIVLNHCLMRNNNDTEGTLYQQYGVFKDKKNSFSAFTTSELGEMLPARIEKDKEVITFFCNKSDKMWETFYCSAKHEIYYYQMGKTLAGAMAKMLIYLKKNNL